MSRPYGKGLGPRGAIVAGASVFLLLAVGVAWPSYELYVAAPRRAGIEQPLPFSHLVHVTDKEIDCRYCHSGVDRHRSAGLPSTETCMGCHQSVITLHPAIVRLTHYFEMAEPIPWVRVSRTPDHVFFSHRSHMARDIQCEQCHGQVGSMDRVGRPFELEMGFCVDCHRALRAPDDCLRCHR